MGAGSAQAAPRIIGLTGPIGCGKTIVGNILLELGAIERIDADKVVHDLMAPGTETTAAVRHEFGEEVIAADGSVNRARLAAIVFGDDARLRRLEAIVHPGVRREVRLRLEALRGRGGVAVVDAVRLLQSDLLPLIEEVWVVRCSPEDQLKRLVELRGMSRSAAQARIAAQPIFEHQAVTRVIENSGSLGELREIVEAAWRQLNAQDVESAPETPKSLPRGG